MNFFCDSGGNIFHIDPEKVYQGSANANTIYFIGAFASNLSVTIAYRLPNGLWTTPILMTAVTDSALANIQDAQGQGYSVWTVKITGTITERYGTVDVQFFVYGNNGTTDGGVLATALSSFEVSKGVPITLPSTPTDNYEVLLTDILAALSTAHGEITYIEEDIRQIKTEQATQNTDIALNRANIAILSNSVGALQDGKVDEIYDPNIVYGTNDTGATVSIPYSANSDPLSIIQRDENGRAQIEAPLTDKDIANKEFVENFVKPVSVNTQSNTAKIENLTNILLDNEQVAIAEVSQAFTTRQTADGENIIDEQNVFPKLIKGSTVKSANLIPFPYYQVSNGKTMYGITFTVDDDGVITASGTTTGSFNAVLRDYFPVKAGEVFSISSGAPIVSGYSLVLLLYDENKDKASYVNEISGGRTYTIPEGKVFGRVVINFSANTTIENAVFKPMLNEGTILPFRPYFSGLKNAYLQSIKSTGRNLIHYPYYDLPKNGTKTMNGITFTDNGDGSITVNGTATGDAYIFLARGSDIELSAGQYTISGNKTGIIINATKNGVWWGQNGTLTAEEGDVFGSISIYVTNGITINNVTVYPMFNHGTTAQPYEPYVKDIFYLPKTLELGEWDKYDPQSGILARWTGYATSEAGFTKEEIASYKDAIVSLDGKTLAYNLVLPQDLITYNMGSTHYKAWNGGTETQMQGATDNSADGAVCTITNDYFVKVGGATNEQTE